MKIKALKELLHDICDSGYQDWIVYFCDDDNDDYTVNHIYVDDDGNICLESTDMEGDNYDLTAEDIYNEIECYDNEDYVYFLEEYYDGSSTGYDIEFNWYVGHDDSGNEIFAQVKQNGMESFIVVRDVAFVEIPALDNNDN